MKKLSGSRLFSVLLGLSLLSPSMAQEQKCHVSDVFVYSGVFSQVLQPTGLSDFRLLAPGSSLLKRDFSSFQSASGHTNHGTGGFGAMLGFRLKDQEGGYKKSPLVRLGIGYTSGGGLSNSFYKSDRKRFDTLTSAQSGQTVYLDSVYSESYHMNYSSEEIRLEGSLVWRTDPEARWSLYGGAGFSAGISFNATTTVSHAKFETVELDGRQQSVFYREVDPGETETFRNKSSFSASAFLPMGVDFRIGNKRDFWKRLHLYYELRPGINFTNIPETRMSVNSSLHQNVGLRVTTGF